MKTNIQISLKKPNYILHFLFLNIIVLDLYVQHHLPIENFNPKQKDFPE